VPSPHGEELTGSKLSIPIYLKGFKTKPTTIEILGSGRQLSYTEVGKISWSSVPGTLFIEVPIAQMDPMITVLELKFKEPLQLYRGKGGFH
jgi:alpha-L-fucosidase